MSDGIGVAVSTTGDLWRMGFLETSVRNWLKVLRSRRERPQLCVTVDGSLEAARRVREAVPNRVPVLMAGKGRPEREGRQGVAVNKNTGISYLMGRSCAHLFLCDDDTYPLSPESLDLHIGGASMHSMVCWGPSRLEKINPDISVWSWPRGVLLYTRATAVRTVGGMVEEFGPGGHEHVEWSTRMFMANLSPAVFCAPRQYGLINGKGARNYWHCEDMRRPDETPDQLGVRRQQITSVRRQEGDWEHIKALMASRRTLASGGSVQYVPYDEFENGRGPVHFIESQGAEEPK